MSIWVSNAAQVLDWVIGFGHTPGMAARLIVLASGLILGLIVLRVSLKGAGVPDLGLTPQIGALFVALGFCLAAAVAAQIYVTPYLHGHAQEIAVRVAAPVLGLLVLGVPSASLLLRGGYGKTLVSLLLALVAATLCMLAVHTLLGSASGEYRQMGKIRDRTQEMDRNLNRR